MPPPHWYTLIIWGVVHPVMLCKIINNNIFVPVSLINLDLNSRNNTHYNFLPIPFTRYNPYFRSFYPSTLCLLNSSSISCNLSLNITLTSSYVVNCISIILGMCSVLAI